MHNAAIIMAKLCLNVHCHSISNIRESVHNHMNESCFRFTSGIHKRMSTSTGTVEGSRLIWVDCEMTGLDLRKDVIMEIAVIITEGDTLKEVGKE